MKMLSLPLELSPLFSRDHLEEGEMPSVFFGLFPFLCILKGSVGPSKGEEKGKEGGRKERGR